MAHARPFSLSLRRGGACVALGSNLWVTGLLVPTLGVGGRELVPLLLPGPILLAFGLVTRSAPALLLGVPLAMLAPLGLPELAPVRQGTLSFVIVALALVAYELAALRTIAVEEAPPDLAARRPLQKTIVPLRWRRRRWMYRGATVLGALVPAALVYLVNLDPTIGRAIDHHWPRPEATRALITVGAAIVAAVVFARALARPLVEHLEGDAPARARVEAARKRSWRFWIMVCLGLSFIAGVAMRVLRDSGSFRGRADVSEASNSGG